MNSLLMTYLSEGEENAITARALACILGASEREVTRCINGLRCGGAVICSTGDGFFLPSSVQDVEKFCRTMRSRQKEIERATKSALDYLKENCGGDICTP